MPGSSVVEVFSRYPYIGSGVDFPFTISSASGGTSQNPLITEVQIYEKVRDALYQILFTRVGERFARRDFGTDLPNIVFEPNDPGIIDALLTRIREQVVQYEKRVDILEMSADTNLDPKNGLLVITLRVRLAGSNREGNLVFPFYVQGGNISPASQADLSNAGIVEVIQ